MKKVERWRWECWGDERRICNKTGDNDDHATLAGTITQSGLAGGRWQSCVSLSSLKKVVILKQTRGQVQEQSELQGNGRGIDDDYSLVQ